MTMNLEEARKLIDQADKELVPLIEQRMNAVVEVGKYKKEHNIPVLDENREKAVLDKIASYTENKDFEDSVRKIFQAIIDTTKEYQQEEIIDQ
ncbi:chorismate mutase [Tetragenococcus halophilus subsp. halophilus]|nr:chorismate mutase [Tetragenococcus halophilus subsp. halophilus]GBD76184.1 chorismate mutase [Tetragenococcus halophilus subsp. halophilus]